MQTLPLDPSAQARTQWRFALLAIAVFAALSVWLGFISEGFLEADSCTHYLYARFAFQEAHFIVNIWGRPFCTGLYALPALIGGREGVRIASMLVAVVVALLTMSVAKRQGHKYPVLALLFVLGQPLFFLHSFSELTEVPFALLVAVGLLAYQRRWWWLLAIVASIMPTSRPEGFGVLLVAAIGLCMHRRWFCLLALPIPFLLWNYAGWIVDYRQGDWWKWVSNNWPYAAESNYPPGPLLYFVGLLPILSSPLVFPAMLVGWAQSWMIGMREGLYGLFDSDDEAHHRRVELIVAGFPFCVLVVHSLLYWYGRMASNGELRYMLVAVPMWGLLAGRGWGWLFDRFRFRHVLLCGAVAVLLPFGANFYYPVVPIKYDQNWIETREIAQWYQETPLKQAYPRLMVAHVGVFYFLDLSPTAVGKVVHWEKIHVDANPPGTMLIWDDIYGLYNSDEKRIITLEHLRQAGWIEQPWPLGEPRTGQSGGPTWRLFVSSRPAEQTE